MRISLIATALIVGFSCFGAASAAPWIDTKPTLSGQSLVEHAQSSAYCRRLRRACKFKDVRGERGEGNCRRYRRICG